MTDQPPGRPTAQSRVTLSRIMTAVDVNLYGTVHGGVPTISAASARRRSVVSTAWLAGPPFRRPGLSNPER